MTQGWTGLRTAVIALGIIAWTTTGAKADALLQYSTVVPVGGTFAPSTDGVTGTNVISLIPVTNVTVDASSNLSLGSFQVAALPAGQTTTYKDTPFTMTFLPSQYTGNNPPLITGTLSGTVTGATDTNNLIATFNPIINPTFTLGGASSTLKILDSQQLLVPSSTAGGTTTIEGIIATVNPEVAAPEPSTIALFLSTVGGLGLRRFVLKRRQRGQA